MQMLARIGLLFFCKRSEIVYFHSFGVEHVPEEIKSLYRKKAFK